MVHNPNQGLDVASSRKKKRMFCTRHSTWALLLVTLAATLPMIYTILLLPFEVIVSGDDIVPPIELDDVAHDTLSRVEQINRSNMSVSPSSNYPSVHVLYCLSGNNSGFLSEFETSLKSVLLNSPVRSSLTVHIMADRVAHDALPDIWYRSGLLVRPRQDHDLPTAQRATPLSSGLSPWVLHHPISIHTYNVESRTAGWSRFLQSRLPHDFTEMISAYTIGAFFRLFADTVLLDRDPSLTHILYLDTDVVPMVHLDAVWRLLDENVAFQWGKSQCSGFILLNLLRMERIWNLANQLNLTALSKELNQNFNDQLVLRAVQNRFPEEVGSLPPEWDVHLANDGLWKGRLEDHRTLVGMMHLNGGGRDKTSVFQKNRLLEGGPHRRGWGLADVYERTSWLRVKFFLESMKINEGHALRIRDFVV